MTPDRRVAIDQDTGPFAVLLRAAKVIFQSRWVLGMMLAGMLGFVVIDSPINRFTKIEARQDAEAVERQAVAAQADSLQSEIDTVRTSVGALLRMGCLDLRERKPQIVDHVRECDPYRRRGP